MEPEGEINGDHIAERAYAASAASIRGCGMLDSGATRGCGSQSHMETIQQDRFDWHEDPLEFV